MADRAAGRAAARAAVRAARDKIQKDISPPDFELAKGHSWVYGKPIGGGAYGTAHLWSHIDDAQKILDRFVVKNFQCTVSETVKAGPAKGQPKEVHISQLLVPDGSTNYYTVPVLACQPIPDTDQGWRTYSPFFSLGSFETLLKGLTKDDPLPEDFVWFFFFRMAKAIVAMDEMLRKDEKGPVVIHNDVKLDNIFLGPPGSLGRDADFIIYPPAYLGDFGMSVIWSKGDAHSRNAGAYGWWAPEQQRLNAEHPYTYTNTWQTGLVVLHAMMGDASYDGSDQPPQDKVPTYSPAKWQDKIDSGHFTDYSKDLLDIVYTCLCCAPKDRPSPQELVCMIEDIMPTHIGDMKRFGTINWVTAKHDAISPEQEENQPLDDPDNENANDPGDSFESLEEDVELDNSDLNTLPYDSDSSPPSLLSSSSTSKKRKLSVINATPLKRPKLESTILTRRLALIAKQMKFGKSARILDTHEDDEEFILPEGYRLEKKALSPERMGCNVCFMLLCYEGGNSAGCCLLG
ncbi:hypothetical protein E4T42_07232 [Aureobasidium subglaciale]|nr:hypothetical protein E4T42_07232 [Aureobasidium subglaciale]